MNIVGHSGPPFRVSLIDENDRCVRGKSSEIAGCYFAHWLSALIFRFKTLSIHSPTNLLPIECLFNIARVIVIERSFNCATWTARLVPFVHDALPLYFNLRNRFAVAPNLINKRFYFIRKQQRFVTDFHGALQQFLAPMECSNSIFLCHVSRNHRSVLPLHAREIQRMPIVSSGGSRLLHFIRWAQFSIENFPANGRCASELTTNNVYFTFSPFAYKYIPVESPVKNHRTESNNVALCRRVRKWRINSGLGIQVFAAG